MNKKVVLFWILLFMGLSLTWIVSVKAPSAGGGGMGMPAGPGGGCWNFNTLSTCDNTSDSYTCQWHSEAMMGGPTGWCEQKGCESYWNEPDCSADGCTWDATSNYCYSKGCWEYSTNSTCITADCSWEGYGYCYEYGCWGFDKKSTCQQANVTYGVNCKWEDMGTPDTTDDYCYEKGCWEYSDQGNCTNGGCTWGSQGGWCSDIGCWDFGAIKTCNAAEGCSWDGGEECRNIGCQDFAIQPTCEDATDNFDCVWDDAYDYCQEIGCWIPELNANANACENNTYSLTCAWDATNSYCYEASCWDYTAALTCNANSADGCYWDSEWNECRERGCWGLWQNQTACENNSYSLDCSWKLSGYCNDPGCWYFNTSSLCTAAGCTWDSDYNNCYEKGCWDYNDQTNCTDTGNTVHSSFDCKWNWYNKSDQTQGGWCYIPECQKYIDQTNCTNTTDELSCAWDSDYNYCYKKGCWDYIDQTDCTNTTLHSDLLDCEWDASGQYCHEAGCWDYWQNESYCVAQGGCVWESGSGWCEGTSAVDCWSVKNNDTCSSNEACVWETYGNCNKKGCWDYGTQLDCEAHAADKRCVWDSEYSNCYEKGCWDYNDQTNCASVGCTWDASGQYCYGEGCWKYNDNDTCLSSSDALTCKWEGYDYCYEAGCGDYSDNEANCKDVSDTVHATFDCSWEESGWCEGGGSCWNYYDEPTCTANSGDGCTWQTSAWCDRIGPWKYSAQSTCEGAEYTWKTEDGSCSEKSEAECWNWDYNQTGCQAQTACQWEDPNCVKKGCWEYTAESACGSAPDVLGCEWHNESMSAGGWCEELGCWNFWEKQDCSGAMQNYSMNCMWQTFGFCEKKNCWMYNDQSECTSVADNLDCSWQGQTEGGCEDMCPNYWSENDCTNAGCTWAPLDPFGGGEYCHSSVNCWDFSNSDTCLTNNCTWREPGWCEGKFGPGDCYNYWNSTLCNADTGCQWKTGWCNDRGCWDYNDQTDCTNTTLHPGTNCTWNSQSGGGGWCEDQGCWNFWNQSACESNTVGLTCQWHVEAWNPQGGWCEEQGCWNQWTSEGCTNAGCEWNSDPGGFGGWCEEPGCWSKTSKDSCDADNSCFWKTETHCEWARCWMFDNITLQGNATEAGCVNNTYGLNCTWDSNGGWCNEYNAGCSAHDGDSNGCKFTGFCWWNEITQKCDTPGDVWIGEMHGEKVNPGCWIFDYESSYCNSSVVDICAWSNETSKCAATKDTGDLGIQCLNIKDSNLCEGISILSTCCVWKNNKCQADATSTKCWENFQAPPAGATFCEDYNAYKDQSVCEKIAGDPWYMPCKWDTKDTADTSDDSCVFRMEDKFGGEFKGCGGITSKKDCEFAGCEWLQEYYCEGEQAVPFGWCEDKAGAGSVSCDAECWSCEFYDSSGNAVNTTNAQTACEGSALGYCEFTSDTTAPNGIGFCDEKNEVKFAKGDCSVDCMVCEFKTEPQTACELSPAKCKWVADRTGTALVGGWCYPKSEKICSEDCFRCYTETECLNYGGGTKGDCTWESATNICKPRNFDKEICFDGTDNDGDGKYDCEDSDCYADPFCGAGSMSDCWIYSEIECKDVSIGGVENCIWIKDPLGDEEWCGLPGENCFLWDGDKTGCESQTGVCDWFQYDASDSNGGFCDMNKTKVQECFKLTSQGACVKNSDCYWTQDSNSPSGGWCEPRIFKCEDKTQTQCESGEWSSRCKWINEEGEGLCEPACITDQLNKKSLCQANSNCQWMTGLCDPSEQLGMNMEDCWKHDNDQTACGNSPACEWRESKGGMGDAMCEINNTKNWECQQIRSQDSCNNQASCKWNGDQFNGWCDLKIFGCGMYQTNDTCINDAESYGGSTGCIWAGESSGWCECTWPVSAEHPIGCTVFCSDYSSKSACDAKLADGCEWRGGSKCEPACFNESLDQTACSSLGLCEWMGAEGGKCEPKFAKQMFSGMEVETVDLGSDEQGCGPGSGDASLPGELDICGFGLLEEPGKFNFGIGVDSLENAALCNGQKIVKSVGPGGTDNLKTITESGKGRNTTKYYLYLDTDGSETGGCPLWHNSSQEGYEFFFKYITKWIDGGTKETKTAYRCEDNEWVVVPGDIKLSTWQSFTCSEIGSPMIIVNKDDLNKFYSLYKPWEKMRVYVATGKSIESNPTDTAGPGAYVQGTIGTKNAFDVKGFKQYGFIESEDCFNLVDDDHDGLIDCSDPDCKFAPHCTGIGVNDADYTDDTTPRLIGDIKVEKFPDSVFIKYDTDEPANGTVQFYYTDSSCQTLNKSIYDIGIMDPYMEDYKNWHDATLNNFAFNPQALGYSLSTNTTYYYKIETCDPSGNCGVTDCYNFSTTTSSSKSDCPLCTATIVIPLGMKIDFGDGYETNADVSACGIGTGVKKNYTQMSSAKVSINGTQGLGEIIFENTTIMDPSAFASLPKVIDNVTTVGGYEVGYVGMEATDFNNLTSKISPGACVVPVPKGSGGTCDKLWHCDSPDNGVLDDSTCTVINATLMNETATQCIWKLRDCRFSVYRADVPSTGGGDTTSSGGGGGGGGGITGALTRVSHLWPEFNPGIEEKWVINRTEMDVTEMNIQLKSLVRNVKITVEKLSDKPATVKDVTGQVYQYLEIAKSNLKDENIESVKIKFKINKTWVSDNNIDETTVALNRYVNDAWKKLSTEKVNEDTDYVYYEAETTGFSTFAITGEKKIPLQEVTTTLPSGETPTTVPTGEIPTTIPGEAREVIPGSMVLIGLVVIVAIVVLVLVKTRHKGKTKEEKEPLI